MEGIIYQGKKLDVICQHTREGRIIPMKIRLQDEDGVFQEYLIKSYKDVTQHSTIQQSEGIFVRGFIWTFECKIIVFGQLRPIRLQYNSHENLWKLL